MKFDEMVFTKTKPRKNPCVIMKIKLLVNILTNKDFTTCDFIFMYYITKNFDNVLFFLISYT